MSTGRGQVHTFTLKSGVAVLGGFAGTETSHDDRNIWANETILSGEIGTSSTSDNSYHVVTANGPVVKPNIGTIGFFGNLDGFTVKFGNDSGSPDGGGAGLFINSTEATSPLIQRCIFANNLALDGLGGGIAIFTDDEDSDPAIVDCVFDSNQAIFGGGIIFSGGKGRLLNCLIKNNRAVEGRGGGVAATSGDTLTISNCQITNNLADDSGGGIYVRTYLMTLVNNTIADNTATAFDGGGMDIGGNPSTPASTITNCIFWDNEAPQGHEIYNFSGGLVISYSDIKGGQGEIAGASVTWGSGNITPADPLFTVPGSNYRPRCGSPVKDVGNNSAVDCDTFDMDDNGVTCGGTSQFNPDQDKKKRVANSIVDMGAFERIACEGDANADGHVDIDDLVLVIVNWGGTSGPADVHPNQCAGNSIINIDDLVKVITSWGECEDAMPYEGGGIPTSFQECWDDCSAEFEAGSEKWHECMDACILSLCRLGYTQYCP